MYILINGFSIDQIQLLLFYQNSYSIATEYLSFFDKLILQHYLGVRAGAIFISVYHSSTLAISDISYPYNTYTSLSSRELIHEALQKKPRNARNKNEVSHLHCIGGGNPSPGAFSAIFLIE
jgi:hypothetical protein